MLLSLPQHYLNYFDLIVYAVDIVIAYPGPVEPKTSSFPQGWHALRKVNAGRDAGKCSVCRLEHLCGRAAVN